MIMRRPTPRLPRSNRARERNLGREFRRWTTIAVALIPASSRMPLAAHQRGDVASVTVSRADAVFTFPMPRRSIWHWSTSRIGRESVEYGWEAHWHPHPPTNVTRGFGCLRRATPTRPEQAGTLAELVTQCQPLSYAFSTCGDLDCRTETPEPALHATSWDSQAVVLRLGKSPLLTTLLRDHPETVLLSVDLRAADTSYDFRAVASYRQ